MTVVVTGGVMWVASFAYQDAGPGDTKYTEYQTIITFVITSDDSPPCRDPAEICSTVCSAPCVGGWHRFSHRATKK